MLPLLSILPAVFGGFSIIKDLVVKYFPNDEDKAKVLKLQTEIEAIRDEMAEKVRVHEEAMANLEINKIQAQSEDKFVSRARPFAMWGASVGTWVFFGFVPSVLLICVLFVPSKITPIMELLNTLGTSGYIGTFITIALGLYGIRGGEKVITNWRTSKANGGSTGSCDDGSSIMTYNVAKGKVGGK